jgi:hypothetical protein
MTNDNLGGSSMNSKKKVWTEPVITTILLQAAKHGTQFGSDHAGSFNTKS